MHLYDQSFGLDFLAAFAHPIASLDEGFCHNSSLDVADLLFDVDEGGLVGILL